MRGAVKEPPQTRGNELFFVAAILHEGDKPVIGADGIPEMREVVSRAANVTIVDTRHVVGTRGTGIHDFKVVNLSVTEEFIEPFNFDTPTETGPPYQPAPTVFAVWSVIGTEFFAHREKIEVTAHELELNWPHQFCIAGRSAAPGCRNSRNAIINARPFVRPSPCAYRKLKPVRYDGAARPAQEWNRDDSANE